MKHFMLLLHSISFDVPKLVKNLHYFFVFENKNAEMGEKTLLMLYSSIIITIFAVAFSCRKPIGLCGRV